MAIDWCEAARLSTADLQQVLMAESERVLADLTDVAADQALDRLDEPVRTLWLLDWLDFEVAQGGLLAYFSSSHGRHAKLAIAALQRIGADSMAAVVAEADRIHARFAGDRSQGPNGSDELGDGAITTARHVVGGTGDLEELTNKYWQAAETEVWGEKLDTYLTEQAASWGSAG